MTEHRKIFHSLSRDFLVLTTIVVLIVALLWFFLANSAYEDYNKNIIKNMEREALRIDRALIIEIKNASYILESLSRQITQIGIDDEEEIADLLKSFERKDSGAGSDEFLWINTDQQIVINSSEGILGKFFDVSERDYVKKSFANPNTIHIGRPVKGKVSDIWILPISLGVKDVEGNFIGIIVFSMNLSRMTQELKAIIKHPKISFSIYTSTLSQVMSTQKKGAVQLDPQGKISQHEQFIEKMRHTAFEKESKGIISKPALFSPITPFNYYYMSSQYPYIVNLTLNNHVESKDNEAEVKTIAKRNAAKDTNQVLDKSDLDYDIDIINTLIWLAIKLFLILGCCIVVLHMIRVFVIKPIDKLTDITADIAEGKGFTPISDNSPIEIERLSHQIRKLAHYIEEQLRITIELRRSNDFLLKTKDKTQLVNDVRNRFTKNITQKVLSPIQQTIAHLESLDASTHSAENKQFIQEAMRSMRDVMQIIGDINTTSEVERSNFAIRESTVNLPFAINRAVRKFNDYEKFKHVEVKITESGKLPQLIIDEVRFLQIIHHIFCGIGATLAQGNNILVELKHGYDDKGKGDLELSIYFKYMPQPHKQDEFSEKKSMVVLTDDMSARQEPRIKTEAVNFELARMLVGLFEGNLEVKSSPNQATRIYLTFPKSRLTA